jgi:hypothetical protein
MTPSSLALPLVWIAAFLCQPTEEGRHEGRGVFAFL